MRKTNYLRYRRFFKLAEQVLRIILALLALIHDLLSIR